MSETNKNLGDQLVEIARKQIDTCIQFKLPRLNEIQKAIDTYANKVDKTLTRRHNVPVPILGGFVDTLKSKIDDRPNIKFARNDETDYKRVKIANAMIERDSSDAQGKWGLKDRASKTAAIFTGRGILKYYAHSDPRYISCLDVPDLFDFIFEPQGGGILENHRFTGEINVFKSRSELVRGAKSKLYDPSQVIRLFSGAGDSKERKEMDDQHANKKSRYAAYGLDPDTNNYVGEDLFNLSEMNVTYRGKRHYLLFDRKSGIWVRHCPLIEMYSSNLYPYMSWATHEDYYNFLSKAPVDDVVPAAEVIRIVINQVLDNNQKRNWGMRAYDPEHVADPASLNWRPDGLIELKNMDNRSIDSVIREIPNPGNIELSINLVEFMDSLVSKNTGVTAGTKGAEEKDARVGIYYGNMQQVADRLGLYNKSYSECYADLGLRYLGGLQDNLSEKESIRIVGINGVEWTEVQRKDLLFDRDPSIIIESSAAQSELNTAKSAKRQEVLGSIGKSPVLASKVSPNWLIQEMLRSADYDDDEIRVAMDTQNEGSQEILAEAAQAIKEIISGGTPKVNRGATTGFMQKILYYEMDHNDLKPEIRQRLLEYAAAHQEIVVRNMERMSRAAVAMPSLATQQQPAGPVQIPSQAPTMTPGETQSRAAQESSSLMP